VLETRSDHRLAFAGALLGLRRPGLVIAGAECVAKSFPGFFDTCSRNVVGTPRTFAALNRRARPE
jgi:3-phosphoshikimate 1-carboxyvinyltransferase